MVCVHDYRKIFDETGLLPKARRLHVQDDVWEQMIEGLFSFENFFILVFSVWREVQPCAGLFESLRPCERWHCRVKGLLAIIEGEVRTGNKL